MDDCRIIIIKQNGDMDLIFSDDSPKLECKNLYEYSYGDDKELKR